jgi:hypothetical protein
MGRQSKVTSVSKRIAQRRPANLLQPRSRIRPRQLRQLQTLWSRWTRKLDLSRQAGQRLRHYYVSAFTGGRAAETRELTEADAARVIRWLRRLIWPAEAQKNYAAGTAGRRGYPEQPRVRPTPTAWRALWACAAELGMQRPDLELFIRRHYRGVGLRGIADLHTMADLNRVLWGLKEILRRRTDPDPFAERDKQVA